MTEKRTLFGRIQQLTRANLNALLDHAEDPQKMLDQLVRDYTNNIAEAEQAIAQTIGNLRLAEQDYNNDVKSAQDWGNKALAASRKADQYREVGDSANADKFDNLARVALGKQLEFENEITTEKPMIEQQRETVERLKNGLVQMKDKLGELKNRKDSLVARQRAAAAQAQVTRAVASLNVLDPTSELGRFEDIVRRQEALALGQAEVAAASMDNQFAQLEMSDKGFEVDARLAALKAGAPATPQIAAPINVEDEDWS